jgi:hypothetical protein
MTPAKPPKPSNKSPSKQPKPVGNSPGETRGKSGTKSAPQFHGKSQSKSLTIPELAARQLALEAEIASVRAEGNFLQGYWVDSSSRGIKVYYRLRWHRGRDEGGKELSPGCRTLSPEETAAARAGIARGKRLEELERELGEVGAELEKKRALARGLGLL